MQFNKITIIGGGNMGSAIVEGIIKSKGLKPEQITVTTEKNRAFLLDKLKDQGVRIMWDNPEAVKDADAIFIAVKPFLVDVIMREVVGSIKSGATVISIAATVEVADLESMINREDIYTYRIIPNIGASLCESMTFITCSPRCIEMNDSVIELLNLFGKTVWVDERFLDAFTVIGSCGIAFALRYLRASMQAGIEIGISSDLAKMAVAQVTKAACELLLNTEDHPEMAIDKVTTPGGITIIGLTEMEHNGMSSAIIKGNVASYLRMTK